MEWSAHKTSASLDPDHWLMQHAMQARIWVKSLLCIETLLINYLRRIKSFFKMHF